MTFNVSLDFLELQTVMWDHGMIPIYRSQMKIGPFSAA